MQPESETLLGEWRRFLGTPLDELLAESDPHAAQARALALFHRTAATVPAYSAFLKEHGVDAGAVRRFADFQRLPVITKENYIQRHPLPELCRNGRIHDCDMVAVSSGSTGQPAVWPRSNADELGVTVRFEQVFRDSFQAQARSTLAVVCFALGTWVGGMYTANCCRHLAAKGYPLTVATPGSNPAEILRVVRELGPHFDQVVLLGYPPFLKGVIDSGISHGVDWTPFRIKLVLAGEVFSEEWRTVVAERIGSESPCRDFAALYGTADGGVLGCETSLSIRVRRFLAANPEAARELFGESRLPTLVQYDPCSRMFEVEDGRLLITGDSGVPLVRYNILDSGGIVTFEAMLAFLQERGFDPLLETGQHSVRRLPFVYVFGRSHFAISYFGANIYPENVMAGLEQPEIRDWTTGKFVLESLEDGNHNRYLSVLVELAPGSEPDSERRDLAAESIQRHLERLNSEFAHYVPEEYRLPRVTLLPAGHPDAFPSGVKHRYTRG